MLAALAIALLGSPRATVTVSDRSEVRVRDSNESTGRAVDLETAPSVSVIVDDRRWRLDAGYTPRFTERALLRESAVRDIYQSVYGSASWQHRQLHLEPGGFRLRTRQLRLQRLLHARTNALLTITRTGGMRNQLL